MKPMMKPDVPNLEMWNWFFETDPSYTKDFKRGGGFQGTAISPMLIAFRMTEMFGPMGNGWGIECQDTKVIEVGGEVMVYILVGLWYNSNGKRCVAGPQWGGDKICAQTKSGLKTDDEAFKKAMTDGMLKCASYLGIGGDVHSGMFDDVKYFTNLEEKFSEKPKPKQKAELPDPSDPATNGGVRGVVTDETLNAAWMELYEAGQKAGKDVQTIRNEGKNRIAMWVEASGIDPKDKPMKNGVIFDGITLWLKELQDGK